MIHKMITMKNIDLYLITLSLYLSYAVKKNIPCVNSVLTKLLKKKIT